MPEIEFSDYLRLPGVLRPIFLLIITIMLICLSSVGGYHWWGHCDPAIDGFMFFILITFLIKIFIQLLLNLFQIWPLPESNAVNFAEWIFDGVYTLLFFCGIWCMLANSINCHYHSAAYVFCTIFSLAMTVLTALHGYFYFIMWKNPARTMVTS